MNMQVFNSVIKNSSFFLLLICTFFILYHSPQFFNEIQPDSSSYINSSPFRQILYHSLLYYIKKIKYRYNSFSNSFDDLSIIYLINFLRKKK